MFRHSSPHKFPPVLLGEPQGGPRPAERHSPSSASWLILLVVSWKESKRSNFLTTKAQKNEPKSRHYSPYCAQFKIIKYTYASLQIYNCLDHLDTVNWLEAEIVSEIPNHWKL